MTTGLGELEVTVSSFLISTINASSTNASSGVCDEPQPTVCG